MENTTLPLALFDFFPITAFVVGGFYLVRISLLLRSSLCSLLTAAGVFLIFLGGFCQASWKLLSLVGISGFSWLGEVQFVLMAPGFLILLGAVQLFAQKQKAKLQPSLMALTPWKMPLLFVMTLSSTAAYSILIYVSMRYRARLAALGFLIALLFLLGMGAMSSGEQTMTQQWIEESVNAMGQTSFAIGAFLLHSKVRMKIMGDS